MCLEAVEVTADVTFSVGAVIAAVYACVHLGTVDRFSGYFVGSGQQYESFRRSEHHLVVAEAVIIAGYFQYIIIAGIVAIVISRCKHYRSQTILLIAGMSVALFASITSIVIVAVATDRLVPMTSELMSKSLLNETLDDLRYETDQITVDRSHRTSVDWHKMHFETGCCGKNGIRDFSVNTRWERRKPESLAPMSCCVRQTYHGDSLNAQDFGLSCLENGTLSDEYYSRGCQDLINDSFIKTKTVVVVLCSFVMALVLVSNTIRCIRCACGDVD